MVRRCPPVRRTTTRAARAAARRLALRAALRRHEERARLLQVAAEVATVLEGRGQQAAADLLWTAVRRLPVLTEREVAAVLRRWGGGDARA